MDWNAILTEAAKAAVPTLILLAAPAVTAGCVAAYRWARARAEAARLAPVVSMLDLAVRAAQKLYGESGQGDVRRAYVVDLVRRRYPNLPQHELDLLLEAAVHDLDLARQSALQPGAKPSGEAENPAVSLSGWATGDTP